MALTERGRGLAPGAPHQAPQQARLVSLLEAALSLSELAAHGISRTVVKALIERELAAPCEVHAEQDWQLDRPAGAKLGAAKRLMPSPLRQAGSLCICFTA